MWLTENGNARSEQVLMMPTEEAIQLRMAARSACRMDWNFPEGPVGF